MGRRAEKTRWLANRLMAMSPAEIAFRVRQSGFRAWAKRQSFTQEVQQPSDTLPCVPVFKTSLLLLAKDPAVAALASAQTSKALNSPFQAFGKSWPVEQGDERWHRDPDTGNLWPEDTFCFDIDFRHRNGMGDAKYVWQRSKLQHLHWPAVLAALTGDEATTNYCIAEIESWITANPPYNGINWASGVECSYRILALCIVCSLVPENAWPLKTRQAINASLEHHGYWLEKNLSLHSSANNHLIVELAGLFLIGVAAPHLPHAKKWNELARAGLQHEALLQFAPDGFSREQSPTYGAFSLEWLSICARFAQWHGAPFASEVIGRIADAASAISELGDQGGNVPRFGDDDDATAFAYSGSRMEWLANVCALATSLQPVVTNPESTKPPAQLMSCVGFAPTSPSKTRFRHFAESGYTVMRRQQTGGETMLVFDHGPLGYLSIAAHGHADALAIWLHRNGTPVIVDAGTYAYGSNPEARNYFRSTQAHNTLTVSNQSSSRMSGPFNWSQHASCHVIKVDPTNQEVSAEHNGFSGCRHKRSVSMSEIGCVIVDSLPGALNSMDVDIRFLLAPEFDARVVDGHVLVSKDNQVIMTASCVGPLRWQVENDHAFPRAGWYSPRMGERVPAVQLHLTGRMSAEDQQITQFEFR